MIYDEIMLYHDEKRVEDYNKKKEEFPDGMLEHVLKPERKKRASGLDNE